MKRIILTGMAFCWVISAFAVPAQIKISDNGTVEIGKTRLTCGFFSKQWQPFFNEKLEEIKRSGNSQKGEFAGQWRIAGKPVSLRQEYEFSTPDTLKLRYEITASGNTEIHSPRLILRIPVSTDLLAFDGKQEQLPAKADRQQLFSALR